MDPGRQYLLLIGGTLEFARMDLRLEATYILIKGGRLEVGTEREPFTHTATITLYGHVKSLELPIFGAKTLAVHHGVVDLHGTPHAVAWTKLKETAPRNTTVLVLMDAVTWPVHSYIVVASTHWAPAGCRNPFTITDWKLKREHQHEVRIIVARLDGGRRLVLDKPLLHEHLGKTFEGSRGRGSRQVEYRAEVGLLSRNIVVQGDGDSGQCLATSTPGSYSCARFGATVMAHSRGHDSSVLRLSHIEFRNVGQGYRMGRFPINFNMPQSSVRSSYVRGCSIHHSFNRALGLGGVSDLLVEDNVAFHILGHAFVTETGIEERNIFKRNLAVMTLQQSGLYETDMEPAGFYIRNPQNVLEGNVAVGSDAYGFFLQIPKSVDGACTPCGKGSLEIRYLMVCYPLSRL